MLTQLYIKNFTIIDAIELDFRQGMTVLTGETGAGKSIIIDAIELALGRRANGSIVKQNAERTDINVSFEIRDLPLVHTCLEKYDLLNDNMDECLIRRTIHQDGRSKSFINGIPTTLQTVRELGDNLINIHGQHEFQNLLKREEQLSILDDFAKNATLLQQLKSLSEDWKTTQSRYEDLKSRSQDAATRSDFLTYQIKELDELNLHEHEIEEIGQEHKQLANADTLLSQCQTALSVLTEDEQYAAQLQLNRAAQAITSIQSLDPALSNVAELINNATIQIDEANNELQHYLEQVDLNPERLQWIDARLSTIHGIARKHRVTPEELFALHQQMKEELNQLETSDEQLQELESQMKKIEAQYLELAKELSKKRKTAAKKLSALITENMQSLGMIGGRFDIVFEARKEIECSPKGLEKVTFAVSANPGQDLQPLTKVASGGELSRISLAIQVIAAKYTATPTLIFDEVDVGIGGATAEIVGELLKQLGENTQVFCITHLAQVAAKGKQHLKVQKNSQEKNTTTQIDYLVQEERIAEIARMIGGVKITNQTLAHAKEMLV